LGRFQCLGRHPNYGEETESADEGEAVKIRIKKGGETAHAELWDNLPDGLSDPLRSGMLPAYPSPALVYFETVYGEEALKDVAGPDGGAEVECPLTIEQAKKWELVIADDEERRRLREAGYLFDKGRHMGGSARPNAS
jgi:hypothetical protein